MTYKLPEKFERKTRWAYLDDNGIEVGPFEPSEMVKLIEERKISPETQLVELTSRKTCAAVEVKPFADLMMSLVTHQKKVQAEKEFDRAKSSAGTVYTASSFVKLAIVGGLVAAIAVAAFLVNRHLKIKKAEEDAKKAAAQVVPVKEEKKEEKKEPEFQILEADVTTVEESEADEKMAKSVLGDNALAPSTKSVTEADKKLEGSKKKTLRKAVKKAANGTVPLPEGGALGVPGAEGAAEEESVETMDFSEDEAEGKASVGGANVDLARSRLAKVVKACAAQVMSGAPDMTSWHISASAELENTGRIKALKLKAEPQLYVGDLKLCASAELAANRVPAFDGQDIPLLVTIDVGAPPSDPGTTSP